MPDESAELAPRPSIVPQVVASEPAPPRVAELSPTDAAGIDLRQIISVLRRRLRLFLIVAAGVMVAAGVLTLLSPREYQATAEVELNRRNTKITKVEDVVSALPMDSQAVDTEIEVLKSRQLAERVVESLGLQRDPEFNPGAAAQTPRPANAKRQAAQVVDNVRGKLSVTRSGVTYVIDIGFKSRNPIKAARIANEFARLYLAQQVEAKAGATRQAAAWLNGRLRDLRAQVTADETAVQQYKIANNLMSAQGATLTEQELSNYNQSLAQAEAQAAEDQARLDTARKQLTRAAAGDDVGEAVASPTVQKLREQREEASAKVAALSSDFKDDYPPLKKARSELADIDGQIKAEIKRVISSLDAKAQVSKRRAAAISASVGEAKGQLASNERAEVRLSELERNAGASRSLYESYLARYKETSSQEGLAQPDAQLVSAAAPPLQPTSPRRAVMLLFGAVLATGAGLGAIGLAELLDAGLWTSADVGRRLNLRYLGAIPDLRTRHGGLLPADYLVEKPFSGFAEAFRSLAASIVHGPNAVPVKTVAVTSALPGEGKTTTAICLARAVALQGRRVLLVDCDLRRKSLNQLVATTPTAGLLEVLAGEAELSQVIVSDRSSGADILPLANAPASTHDVFGSPEMGRLLRRLSGAYDLVVLDTAPVIPVADSRVLARQADFVVVVARWRDTPYQAVAGALGLLRDSKVKIGGIVLNRVNMQEQVRHGYGDVTHFYTAYKDYYLEPGDRRA